MANYYNVSVFLLLTYTVNVVECVRGKIECIYITGNKFFETYSSFENSFESLQNTTNDIDSAKPQRSWGRRLPHDSLQAEMTGQQQTNMGVQNEIHYEYPIGGVGAIITYMSFNVNGEVNHHVLFTGGPGAQHFYLRVDFRKGPDKTLNASLQVYGYECCDVLPDVRPDDRVKPKSSASRYLGPFSICLNMLVFCFYLIML